MYVALLVAACGSDGASQTSPAQTLNAEVCTEGEARATVLYIRNLSDFDWQEVTVDLVKSDNAYQGTFDKMPPETGHPAEPFTDSTQFSFDDSPGSTRLNPIGDRVAWRASLGNFANLDGASIAIATPFAAEWTGEVHACQ